MEQSENVIFTQTETIYLSPNKLIERLAEFFEVENIQKAKYVFIYFDKMF